MTMQAESSILSVCMTLPTVAEPQQGVFVYRRLQAISRIWPVQALRPQPWFPALKSHVLEQPLNEPNLRVDSRCMFYLPGIAKSLDGWWMERCLKRWLKELTPRPTKSALDAHFAYPEGVACHRIAHKLGWPFFITLRGVEEEWLLVPAIRRQIVNALNAATGVISVSQSLRSAVEKLGVNTDKFHVIPNGCDTKVFSPGNKQVARQKLKIDGRKALLVSVANLKPVKGHDVLIRALWQLKNSVDFELVCIGDHENSNFARQLQQLAVECGVVDRVRFIGPLPAETIVEFLRAADLFVLASHREGCCNAIIEAMACGTPIVATAVGDNPLFAARYDKFQLSPANDPDAFANALQLGLKMSASNFGPKECQFLPASWDDVAAECVEYMSHRLDAGRLRAE